VSSAPVVNGGMTAVGGAPRVVEVSCQVQQCCHVVRLRTNTQTACSEIIMHRCELHCNHVYAVTEHRHTAVLC
jgi:hypothetical protein